MVIEKVCIISRNVPREAFTIHWAWQDCGVCLTLQIKDTMKPVEISLRSPVTHFSNYGVNLSDHINKWAIPQKRKSIALTLPVMQLLNSRLNRSQVIFSKILDKKSQFTIWNCIWYGDIQLSMNFTKFSICKILPFQLDNNKNCDWTFFSCFLSDEQCDAGYQGNECCTSQCKLTNANATCYIGMCQAFKRRLQTPHICYATLYLTDTRYRQSKNVNKLSLTYTGCGLEKLSQQLYHGTNFKV